MGGAGRGLLFCQCLSSVWVGGMPSWPALADRELKQNPQTQTHSTWLSILSFSFKLSIVWSITYISSPPLPLTSPQSFPPHQHIISLPTLYCLCPWVTLICMHVSFLVDLSISSNTLHTFPDPFYRWGKGCLFFPWGGKNLASFPGHYDLTPVLLSTESYFRK